MDAECSQGTEDASQGSGDFSGSGRRKFQSADVHAELLKAAKVMSYLLAALTFLEDFIDGLLPNW